MKTVHGYELLKLTTDRYGSPVALIDRKLSFCSYVVAWCYSADDDTWGQGHYFTDLEDAMECFNSYK